MRIHHAGLWLAQTNCYVVSREAGGIGVVIDAPPDLEAVVEIVEEAEVVPVALLATHGHVDHIGGAGVVTRRYGLTAYLHPDDEWLALDPDAQLRSLFGMTVPGDFTPPERYEQLVDGQVLDLAGVTYRVLHTPGHTPGHCCFHVADEAVLFAGDQLFAGSIGRTDLPGGDFDTLMCSMRDKIIGLPAETGVFPGHGPVTTIARELQTNPFLDRFRT